MSGIQYISPKLSYHEKPDELTVVISAAISKNKYRLFTVWMVLFAVSGLIIASQLFVPGYEGYTRIGFFAFTCFWAYFMYKTGYAWMWRRHGFEFLRIHDGKLSIKRAIKKYGKSYEFLAGNIKDLELREKNARSFSSELENSFWVLGGERLKFDYLGREIRFGMQLTDNEAKKLGQLLIRWIKNHKS